MRSCGLSPFGGVTMSSTMITVTKGLTWFIEILPKSNQTIIVPLSQWSHWDLESLNKTKLLFFLVEKAETPTAKLLKTANFS